MAVLQAVVQVLEKQRQAQVQEKGKETEKAAVQEKALGLEQELEKALVTEQAQAAALEAVVAQVLEEDQAAA